MSQKFLKFTKSNGETVWLNPLRITEIRLIPLTGQLLIARDDREYILSVPEPEISKVISQLDGDNKEDGMGEEHY